MSSSDYPLLKDTAQVDAAAVEPLPGSSKIYVSGSSPDIRVPMREIKLTATPVQNSDGSSRLEPNAPIRVYDTSGPYTDPKASIDIRKGLAPLREQWIVGRGDTEVLSGESSEYSRKRAADLSLAQLRFDLKRKPRRAIAGKNVSQMHYARQGIVTPEMEYIAIRENMALAQAREAGELGFQHPGNAFGASIPKEITPEFVRDEPRPRHYSRQYQSPGAGAHDHWPQLPGEGERQYR